VIWTFDSQGNFMHECSVFQWEHFVIKAMRMGYSAAALDKALNPVVVA
jgi:hypothetical protein